MAKILIIDDDNSICRLLDRFLKTNGHDSNYVTCGKKALAFLNENTVDIVFCDYRLPDTNGTELLVNIKTLNPGIRVIIITGYSDIKIAVDVIKNGAFDFVIKPFLPEELLLLTEEALKDKTEQVPKYMHIANLEEEQAEVIPNKKLVIHDVLVIGKSKEAGKLHYQVSLVAPTNYSVIIYGESGTGKESVAFGIHKESLRKNKPFVAVDCGSLTKELAGSELFGHEKGSFTGAIQTKIGQFELANGGTIFLDEIGNLTYDIQMSLLRVIQERKIRRIGSEKEITIDVRIIVALNEKLNEAITKGKFREDLFHRLNEFSIDLPSLRERNEDIMIFAASFLKTANDELGKNITGFAPEVEKIFLGYGWPGNLREMKNAVRRAALLSDTDTIMLETLPQGLTLKQQLVLTENTKDNPLTHQNIAGLKSAALQAEYEMIVQTLHKVNFNKTKAALLLNIDRKTLYNKISSFDLLEQVGF